MKFSARQVFVTLFSMLLTLGALWAGHRLYQQTTVTSPLVDTFSHVSGVKRATVHSDTVTVQLNPNANLMAVYRSINNHATTVLGHVPTSIDLVNNTDGSLNGLASNMAFVIAQGQATGQFVTMQTHLLAMAKQAGVTANVQMGSHHLYLTLRQESHVLYQVIPVNPGGEQT